MKLKMAVKYFEHNIQKEDISGFFWNSFESTKVHGVLISGLKKTKIG